MQEDLCRTQNQRDTAQQEAAQLQTAVEEQRQHLQQKAQHIGQLEEGTRVRDGRIADLNHAIA